MNKENSVNKLSQTKIWADSEKYFSLFDRHIPSLGKGRTVLLYSIDNVDCILKIAAKNPDASYVVYGDPPVNRMVEKLLPGVRTIDETQENRKAYNIDMNFDCVIMNPPYDKNLHLKILAEAIKHLNDENSKVVNLSPVRWLQDPLAKEKKLSAYNKFKLIRDKLESLEVMNPIKTNVIFNIGCSSLGIYTVGKGGYDCENLISPVVKKVLEKTMNFPVLEENAKDGWRVRIPLINSNGNGGGSGAQKLYGFGKLFAFFEGRKDNKWWWEFYQANQFTKRTETITLSVKFDSETEAENFIKTLDTFFGKYYTQSVVVDVHVNPKQILWMGDAVNPRTGLKGYLGEWTDDDFCKFFGVTDDEKKIIEETMAKYVKK